MPSLRRSLLLVVTTLLLVSPLHAVDAAPAFTWSGLDQTLLTLAGEDDAHRVVGQRALRSSPQISDQPGALASLPQREMPHGNAAIPS